MYNEFLRNYFYNFFRFITNVFKNPIIFLKLCTLIKKKHGLNCMLTVLTRGRYSSNLKVKQIFNILINHHNFIEKNLTISDLFVKNASIWDDLTSDGEHIQIKLETPLYYLSHEGELSFNLIFEKKIIYTIGFVLNPDFLYITKIQGANGEYEILKRIYKHFKSLDCLSVLVSAIEAFCVFTKINKIIVVSTQNQLSYRKKSNLITFDYNNFACLYKKTVDSNGDHEIFLPLITEVKNHSKNKSRHKKHTLIKKEVFNKVLAKLNFCGTPSLLSGRF